MAKSFEQYAHQEWLGYVQPTGLVVSIPALLAAQAQVNKNIAPDHRRFLSCLPRDENDELILEIRDFHEFTETVLQWEPGDLLGRPGGEPLPTGLEVALPEYNETLRPTYAVKEFEPQDADNPWLMLVQGLPTATDLDSVAEQDGRRWQASSQAKFERLLRETQVPFGLLTNSTQLRLVYAPRGETSGYMTFSVREMATVAGRPIFAALHMLLCAERLFSLPEKQRLPAILADSRKYQNVVSTKLAEQVLAALNELLRGFQAANDQRKGQLLRELLAEDPNHGYAGLLTVLLRLVFILYAEDRGLLSSDSVYTNFYSVTGLFERLRADAGRFPDTMDQRYGAWAQLLTLFRLVYQGGSHGAFSIPARKGYLFDPDRYPFLEGRPWRASEQDDAKPNIPRLAEPARFGWRAAQLPDARRRADRQRLRDDHGFQSRSRHGPRHRAQAGQVARGADHDRSGSPARNQRRPTAQMDQRQRRPEDYGPGGHGTEEGRESRRPARRIGQENRQEGHPERRSQGGHGPATERRAAA